MDVRASSTSPISREHAWVDDTCRACGLRRYTTWVLDSQTRPVQALVRTDASRRPIRAVEFPYMLATTPPVPVVVRLSEAVPGVPIGRETRCEFGRYGSTA